MLHDMVLLNRIKPGVFDSPDLGCISIYDQRDKFRACLDPHGKWHDSLIFNFKELQMFDYIEDDYEIQRVLDIARTALNRPYVPLAEAVTVQRGSLGEAYIHDSRDGFTASMDCDGVWHSEPLFQDSERNEFVTISDEYEILRTLNKGRDAFRPLSDLVTVRRSSAGTIYLNDRRDGFSACKSTTGQWQTEYIVEKDRPDQPQDEVLKDSIQIRGWLAEARAVLRDLARLVLCQRSESGLIRLYDSRDKFSACRRYGKWHDTLMFDDDELDDFYLILDHDEIHRLLEVARYVLKCPQQPFQRILRESGLP